MVDVQPYYETVEVVSPREVCRYEQVQAPRYYDDRRRSATVPIVGAIVGGVLGHAVGDGRNSRRVGAAVGAVLGGSIGADIARNNARNNARRQAAYPVSTGQRRVCSVVDEVHEEERVAGYTVRYAYAGEIHSTRMDRDPGDTLEVRVHVAPAG